LQPEELRTFSQREILGMDSKSIHVLLCEDNRDLLADYAAVLSADTRFSIAGMASNGAQALSILQREPVDLLLLDLGLPDMSGLDILMQMRKIQPDCEAIVVTVFCDEKTVVRAIECGAHGYLLKQEASFNLIRVPPRHRTTSRRQKTLSSIFRLRRRSANRK
jgi:DNA-binding NarL/FixJ family response regulator